MLALITLLLATLAMSVRGAGLNYRNLTSVSMPNATLSKFDHKPCIPETDTEVCDCFLSELYGYGVDRHWMIDGELKTQGGFSEMRVPSYSRQPLKGSRYH